MDAYLCDASLLLVLDNFEHVLDASADVGRLLALAPGLVVLATSRTALQLRWEPTSAVAPLPTEVGAAVFVERAQACRPDFVYADANAVAIDEIVERSNQRVNRNLNSFQCPRANNKDVATDPTGE